MSQALAATGCGHFFVARASEGVALRRVLAKPEIHVLEGVFPETVDALLKHGLNPVLNSPEQLAIWGATHPSAITVHVDTGMNRLGFPFDVSPEAFAGCQVQFLMTCLACADEPDHPLNALQLQRIERLRQWRGQWSNGGMPLRSAAKRRARSRVPSGRLRRIATSK